MESNFVHNLKHVEQNSFGKEIFDLFKVSSSDIDIEKTFAISNEFFVLYKSQNIKNIKQIENISKEITEIFKEYQLIDIFPSLKRENYGFPSFTALRIDKQTITNKILEIYDSWFDFKAKAHRISHSIPDEDTYPAIYIQPYRKIVNTLVTRCPKSGQITNQTNLNNIHNSINNFDKRHEELILKLENCMKRPIHFSFIMENDFLRIKCISSETMTLNALWVSITDLFFKNIINKEEYINLIEPEMIIEKSGIRVVNQDKDVTIIYGLPASPGISIGKLVFSFTDINQFDTSSIFCCYEASPEDLYKISKTVAVFSARGGTTSHVAVVSKSLGIPAVVGASFYVDTKRELLLIGENVFPELSYVMVDGNQGKVFLSNKPIDVENNFKASSSFDHLKSAYSIITSLSNTKNFKEFSVEFQLKIAKLLNAFNKIQFSQ